MLDTTKPELQNEIETLERLYHLRDVTIPWMEANPERVDFDHYESECETYRCLAGWDYHFNGSKKNPSNTTCLEDAEFYGLNRSNVEPDDWTFLFAEEDYAGSLSDRKFYLTHTVIPRKEARRDALMRGVDGLQ